MELQESRDFLRSILDKRKNMTEEEVEERLNYVIDLEQSYSEYLEIESEEKAVLVIEAIKEAVDRAKKQTYKPKYIYIDSVMTEPINPWKKE